MDPTWKFLRLSAMMMPADHMANPLQHTELSEADDPLVVADPADVRHEDHQGRDTSQPVQRAGRVERRRFRQTWSVQPAAPTPDPTSMEW